MYMCVCLYVNLYMCMYKSISMSMSSMSSMSMSMSMYAWTDVWMYGCMDVWMYGWISELHPAYFFIILEFRLPSPAAESPSSDSSPDRWK